MANRPADPVDCSPSTSEGTRSPAVDERVQALKETRDYLRSRFPADPPHLRP